MMTIKHNIYVSRMSEDLPYGQIKTENGEVYYFNRKYQLLNPPVLQEEIDFKIEGERTYFYGNGVEPPWRSGKTLQLCEEKMKAVNLDFAYWRRPVNEEEAKKACEYYPTNYYKKYVGKIAHPFESIHKQSQKRGANHQ